MGFHYCSVDINDYVFSRRCFMTGEYCSKQLNVQRERERLHKNGEINAFVIMSFTNMTDVVYRWRIKTYVESLAKNLYFRSETGIDFDSIPEDMSKVETCLKELKKLKGQSQNSDEKKKTFSDYLRIVAKKNDNLPDENARLYCYATKDKHYNVLVRDLDEKKYYPEFKVQKINVIRADSNPSSNFVICNRVCQQMQIADLVVVDVSDENTNVFYELGMAIALRKLILPICYSESYFAMQLPDGVKEEQKKRLERFRKDFSYDPNTVKQWYNKEKWFMDGWVKNNESDEISNYCNDGPTLYKTQDGFRIHNTIVNALEHHIDCYPWRRQLFEHFGIRYRLKENENSPSDNAEYLPFEVVTQKLFGFSDLKYDRFPYLETHKFSGGSEEKLGITLYNRLRESFNSANSDSSADNTLVIYSMDRFLNPEDGWQCIANYYCAYVKPLQAEHCFCGDRVGLLVQPAAIAEPIKDAEERRHLLYNIGEIIQIGINQATYLADREMIKPQKQKYMPELKENASEGNSENESSRSVELHEWDEGLRIFMKEYLRNRSFPIYPKDPVYINRVASGAHDDLFNEVYTDPQPEECTSQKSFFCLYHIMLRNLKYVSEVAVDITQNSVQSLFWLGVAHASGIYAITIRHDKTEEEKKHLAEAEEERGQQFPLGSGRRIFDISGLWTAVLHSYDTEGFYTQLKRVQLGIEQRNKLMLRDTDSLNEEMSDVFGIPTYSFQRIKASGKRRRASEKNRQRSTRKRKSGKRNYWNPSTGIASGGQCSDGTDWKSMPVRIPPRVATDIQT